MPDALGAAESQFLTFRLDGRLYALPAEEVSEVIRVPALARVPQASRGLMGLGNLRGSVLPIASGRALLGQDPGQPSRAIVLNGPAPVAVAVDSVEGLVAVSSSRIEAEPAALASEPGDRLKGAFQASGASDVANILDVWPLLEAAFVQEARAPKPQAAKQPGLRASQGEGLAGQDIERLVTFDVAGQEFALPLEDVLEIIRPPDSLAVALRGEAAVVGMTSLREALLPLFSMRGLLGFAPGASDGREKVLVIRVRGALAGLVVDSVRAIIPAEQSRVDPIPAVLAARSAGEAKIKAIYRGEGGRRLISILSKEQLFREDVMQRLTGRAESVPNHGGENASGGAELRFVVFRLGAEEFGLPIEAVDEVARAPDQVTRVPKTPRFLEGVINFRSTVLPVVDQRRRFDMPPAESGASRRLMVVRTGKHRAGIIVDGVSEVLRSTGEAIEPAPNLSGEATRLVRGLINLDRAGRIVMLLDPDELLSRAEHSLLESFGSRTGQAAS